MQSHDYVHKVSALLDDSKKEVFFEEVVEEYEDIRDEHYQSLKVTLHWTKNFVTIFIVCSSRITNACHWRRQEIKQSPFNSNGVHINQVTYLFALVVIEVIFSSVVPSKLGITVINDYNLSKLIPYIDWKPFFDVWQLRGKYPNRGYPRIFDDADVGKYLLLFLSIFKLRCALIRTTGKKRV